MMMMMMMVMMLLLLKAAPKPGNASEPLLYAAPNSVLPVTDSSIVLSLSKTVQKGAASSLILAPTTLNGASSPRQRYARTPSGHLSSHRPDSQIHGKTRSTVRASYLGECSDGGGLRQYGQVWFPEARAQVPSLLPPKGA